MPDATVTQDDLDKLRRDLAEEFAPNWLRPEVERLRGWRKQLEADSAFGNIMGSTQWVGGASIVDGTIQGKKFSAEVTISSLFTTAESPADRWELDSSGIRQYATVSGVPNQKIVDINSAGFQFGTSGNNVITFNAATGVLSAPGLQTTSLSIANVTSGTIGGTYDTSVPNPKVQLSPNGLRAFNAGGTRTVDIAAASGNVTITGVFEISNATVGDRIMLKDTGAELWHNGVREFYLARGSSNAIQMLLVGPSVNQYIGMQPDTGLWVGASTFASAPFKVSPVGVATMVGATLQSNTSATRVEITSSGLKSYFGGTQMVNIDGTNNEITGGLIRTGTTGSRVEMDSTGLYGYSASTMVFKVGTNGTGFLGNSSGVSWNGTSVTVDGATLNAASVTGSKIANSTIGTALIQSAAITDGLIANMSANKITTGSISTATITVTGSGSITNSDGDKWGPNGITLVSPSGTGSMGDTINWQAPAGTNRGSVYWSGSAMVISSYGTAGLFLNTQSSGSVTSNSITVLGGLSTQQAIYPGTGAASQSSYYIQGGGSIQSNGIGIGGMLGISSGNTINLVSPGTGGGGAGWWSSWGGAAGADYFILQIGGTNYRVPFLANG